jgi:hypothetical protein
LTASWPALSALPPTARSIWPLLRAVLIKASLPDGFPAARGVNETDRLALWPAVKTSGNAGAVIRNSESEATVLAIVTLAAVLLVRVSVSVLLLPTTTDPKSRLELAAQTLLF